jgi:hypothetical protein
MGATARASWDSRWTAFSSVTVIFLRLRYIHQVSSLWIQGARST